MKVNIHSTNIGSFDLNLLTALDALLREESVSRASDRIGLSQPAVSHALRRLRAAFNDPLLVRVGARMQLTPRAQTLRGPVAAALDRVRALLDSPTFDPLNSGRRFTLMVPDLVAAHLTPLLMRHLAKEAPNVIVEIAPWRGGTDAEVDLSAHLDLIISYDAHRFPGFERAALFLDRDVLACAAPRPERARLQTLEGFRKARHIAVIGRGEHADPIDIWLTQHKIERRIALIVPTYLQALHAAAATDMVAFVPSRLLAAGASLDLVAVPPPVQPEPDTQCLFHPTRAALDPASIWLRGVIRSLVGESGLET
jgi:DNA-binding transcriptional LysR family regulator